MLIIKTKEQILADKLFGKENIKISEFKDEILKAMDEYADQFKRNNGCVCNSLESTGYTNIGWTTIKCCNHCGFPVEEFWNKTFF